MRWAGENIFPIFNVADMAVFFGVVTLLAYQSLWLPADEARAKV